MSGGFQVIFQWLAANRDPFFKDDSCLAAGEGIAFQGIRGVGQFHVIPRVQGSQAGTRERAQKVERFLLLLHAF